MKKNYEFKFDGYAHLSIEGEEVVKCINEHLEEDSFESTMAASTLYQAAITRHKDAKRYTILTMKSLGS